MTKPHTDDRSDWLIYETPDYIRIRITAVDGTATTIDLTDRDTAIDFFTEGLKRAKRFHP